MDTSEQPTTPPQEDISQEAPPTAATQQEEQGPVEALLSLKSSHEPSQSELEILGIEKVKLKIKLLESQVKSLGLKEQEITRKRRESLAKICKDSPLNQVNHKPTVKEINELIIDILTVYDRYGYEQGEHTVLQFIESQDALDNDLVSTLRALLAGMQQSNPMTAQYVNGAREITDVKDLLVHLAVKGENASKSEVVQAKMEANQKVQALQMLNYQVDDPVKSTTIALTAACAALEKLVGLGAPEAAHEHVEAVTTKLKELYMAENYRTIYQNTGPVEFPQNAKNNLKGWVMLSNYGTALSELVRLSKPIPKAKEKEDKDKKKEKSDEDQIQRLQDLLTRERNKNGNSDQRAKERNNNSKTPTRVGAVEEKPLKVKCAYCEKHAPKNGLVTHYKSKDNMCFGERLDKGVDDAGQKLTMAKRTALIESLSRLTGGNVIYTGTA